MENVNLKKGDITHYVREVGSKFEYSPKRWESAIRRENANSVWRILSPMYPKTVVVSFQMPIDTVYTFFNESFLIPSQLNSLKSEIEESKAILSLKDDWDDEGALAPSEIGYKKAIRFLLLYTLKIYKEYGVIIQKPLIHPTFDGSVYLHWDSEKSSFLIIFKDELPTISYFYGENKMNKIPFKGGTIIEDVVDNHIAVWMKEYLI